jgi:hypothetical protein
MVISTAHVAAIPPSSTAVMSITCTMVTYIIRLETLAPRLWRSIPWKLVRRTRMAAHLTTVVRGTSPRIYTVPIADMRLCPTAITSTISLMTTCTILMAIIVMIMVRSKSLTKVETSSGYPSDRRFFTEDNEGNED